MTTSRPPCRPPGDQSAVRLSTSMHTGDRRPSTTPAALVSAKPESASRGEALSKLVRDHAPHQAPCTLHECQLLGQARLEQHTHAVMSGYVGHRRQRDVLSDAHVNDMLDLGEDEEMPRHRRLNLRDLLAEILQHHVMELVAHRLRFF